MSPPRAATAASSSSSSPATPPGDHSCLPRAPQHPSSSPGQTPSLGPEIWAHLSLPSLRTLAGTPHLGPLPATTPPSQPPCLHGAGSLPCLLSAACCTVGCAGGTPSSAPKPFCTAWHGSVPRAAALPAVPLQGSLLSPHPTALPGHNLRHKTKALRHVPAQCRSRQAATRLHTLRPGGFGFGGWVFFVCVACLFCACRLCSSHAKHQAHHACRSAAGP